MATAIQDAAAKIDARISELNKELAQLEKAQAALSGVAGPAPARKSRRSPSTARKRSSKRRVDRAGEFKKLVAANPKIKPADAAREMGISSQQVHGLIKRLTERGEVSRSAKGFAVK